MDVIKPELGNVLRAQRRIDIDDREHQHQNKCVFLNRTHAAHPRPPPGKAPSGAARRSLTRVTLYPTVYNHQCWRLWPENAPELGRFHKETNKGGRMSDQAARTLSYVRYTSDTG
jgi:hypothetical protein